MKLKERIDKADDYSKKVKTDLENIIKEYETEKENVVPSQLLDLKDRFIALEYQIGNLSVRSRELHGLAGIEAKSVYNVAYIDEKQNYEDGKKPTNEMAGITARLKSAAEAIMEVQAEMIYKQYYHYQSACNNYITQLSQRIKGLQQDWVNSNNTNNG